MHSQTIETRRERCWIVGATGNWAGRIESQFGCLVTGAKAGRTSLREQGCSIERVWTCRGDGEQISEAFG